MARLILGVTGSVAAIRTPALFRALVAAGHEVRVVATEPALYFFRSRELSSTSAERPTLPKEQVALSRRRRMAGCARTSAAIQVLHIELRKWADMLIVAPLDANTLAKFALGLSDNCLTCIFRAWDFSKPVILAPAMNTFMWESPVTLRHLRQLLEDRARSTSSQRLDLDEAPAVFARLRPANRA